MIHFNALDFNVCRSEEVMFLLTLSVDTFVCETDTQGNLKYFKSYC